MRGFGIGFLSFKSEIFHLSLEFSENLSDLLLKNIKLPGLVSRLFLILEKVRFDSDGKLDTKLEAESLTSLSFVSCVGED